MRRIKAIMVGQTMEVWAMVNMCFVHPSGRCIRKMKFFSFPRNLYLLF